MAQTRFPILRNLLIYLPQPTRRYAGCPSLFRALALGMRRLCASSVPDASIHNRSPTASGSDTRACAGPPAFGRASTATLAARSGTPLGTQYCEFIGIDPSGARVRHGPLQAGPVQGLTPPPL